MALTMRPNGEMTTTAILQAEEESRRRAAQIAEIDRRHHREMGLLRDVAEAAELVLADTSSAKARKRLRDALNALKEPT